MLEESDDNNGDAEQLAEAEASEAGSGSVPGASVTGAGAEEQPWTSNPSYLTGPNSPTKITSKSDVWKQVECLKPGHPYMHRTRLRAFHEVE